MPAKRRCTIWSGRRGSNPRQPAWKAGCHSLAASLLRTGLTGSCIPYTSNMSIPDKRCQAHFWAPLAKDVTCKFGCLRKKVLRSDEGRISQAQSALEQDYQNFCTSSSEAGGLPFYHRLHSFTKAQLFLLNARHHMVNALRSERILSVFAGSLPPLMSSTAKGLISSRSTSEQLHPIWSIRHGRRQAH